MMIDQHGEMALGVTEKVKLSPNTSSETEIVKDRHVAALREIIPVAVSSETFLAIYKGEVGSFANAGPLGEKLERDEKRQARTLLQHALHHELIEDPDTKVRARVILDRDVSRVDLTKFIRSVYKLSELPEEYIREFAEKRVSPMDMVQLPEPEVLIDELLKSINQKRAKNGFGPVRRDLLTEQLAAYGGLTSSNAAKVEIYMPDNVYL